MKNKLKKLLPILLLAFAIPITVYAAMQWSGTEHVDNIKTNLSQISVKLDDLRASNSDKDKVIKDIEKLLEQTEKGAKKNVRELERLKVENAELHTDNKAKDKELEQALKDVQEIERMTEELVK